MGPPESASEDREFDLPVTAKCSVCSAEDNLECHRFITTAGDEVSREYLCRDHDTPHGVKRVPAVSTKIGRNERCPECKKKGVEMKFKKCKEHYAR